MSETPVRVLVVEDDPDDFMIFQKMLSSVKNRRYELERVATYEEALSRLEAAAHDVCVLDYRLKGKTGLDFLRESKRRGCSIPILLLTGQGDYEVDLEAMQLGAAEFLHKNGINSVLLERSIRYALERHKAEDALRRQEEFFREIIENSLDGVAIVGPKGVQYLSPSVERILGYTREEVTQAGIGMIHPDDQAPIQEAFRRLYQATGPVQDFLFRARHKNGSWRTLQLFVKNAMNVKSVNGVVVNFHDVTDRQKAREAAARLATIVENSNDAIMGCDLEGRITHWNHGAELIYGYSEEEALGKPADMLQTEENQGENRQQIDLIKRGGSLHHFESVRRRKDGQLVNVSVSMSPYKDADGRITGLSAIVRDITSQRRFIETISRLASVVESSNDAIYTLSPEGVILSWNPGASKIYGYTAEEIGGRDFSALVPEKNKAETADLLKLVSQGEAVSDFAAIHLSKKGSDLPLSISFSPIKDRLGRVFRVSVIARDIAERKKAEEVQAQLAAILQQTPDAVVGTDLEHRIYSWNKGAEAMFGYSLEEIVGQPVTVLAPEDLKQETLDIRQAVLRGENISGLETVRVRKEEGLLDVSVTLSAVKNPHGKVIGVSAILRDITERKKAEASLRHHEEQLRQAEKMNAIGRLAGGVAHDFNNLLSVIGGNAEFLLSNMEEKDPKREELSEIQNAVKRGAELTKQLLVFGQKQVSQPQPVNLNALSSEMNKMLRRLIESTVELAIIQDKNLKPIQADPGQMQQIILNLVLNAKDAMPKGGTLIVETKQVEPAHLWEEARPGLPPGGYARLNVTDTGTGMTEEIQKHIFEPFFTTKAGKGTGLGLATVYGLVQKWGGHIFVHSTPGMGSTFSLYFPAMGGAETKADKPRQMNLIPQGSETVLLAEDEAPVRRVLVKTLQKYGYQVVDAENGLQALQKAWGTKEEIHLLLTDTVMPKMNGKELADELRKTRPKIKVIFISGYPKEILSQQGVLAADIHLIQKPFDLEDMVRQVRKILDEK